MAFRIKLEFSSFNPCKFSPIHAFHNGLIDLYRKFPSDLRSYNPSTKKWTFNLAAHDKFINYITKENPKIEILHLPETTVKYFTNLESSKLCDSELALEDITDKISSRFQDNMFPYQVEGAHFVIQRGGRALIGDDMGLGKTVQGLAVADYYREQWPLLIICPSSVRFNWKFEALRWLDDIEDEDILVVTKSSMTLDAQICIISHDLAQSLKKAGNLADGQFDVIIVDESHYLKNPEAQRTKQVTPLIQKASRAVLLSGTPAVSRPVELYPQLHMLCPKLFPNYYQFTERYCDGHKGAFGYEAKGASNLEELQLLLKSTVMIRRLKTDYPDSLPVKDREWVEIEADSNLIEEIKQGRKELEELKKEQDISNGDEANAAKLEVQRKNLLSKLYRLSGRAKIRSAITHIQEMLSLTKQAPKTKYALDYDNSSGLEHRQEGSTLKRQLKMNDSTQDLVDSDEEFEDSKQFKRLHRGTPSTQSSSSANSQVETTRKRPKQACTATQDSSQESAGSSNESPVDGANQGESERLCSSQVSEFDPFISQPTLSMDDGDTEGEDGKVMDEVNTSTIEPNFEEIQDKTTSKCVVFCHNMDVMDAIQAALEASAVTFVRIDGKTTSKKRFELAEQFQTNPRISVALLSMTACGQGLTLHAANLAIFAELHWTPGLLRQCEDRIHRVGQVSDVRIQYLVNKQTLDSDVLSVLQKKEGVLSSAVGQSADSPSKIKVKATTGYAVAEKSETNLDHKAQQQTLSPFLSACNTKFAASAPNQHLQQATLAQFFNPSRNKPNANETTAEASDNAIPVINNKMAQEAKLSADILAKIEANKKAALFKREQAKMRNMQMSSPLSVETHHSNSVTQNQNYPNQHCNPQVSPSLNTCVQPSASPDQQKRMEDSRLKALQKLKSNEQGIHDVFQYKGHN